MSTIKGRKAFSGSRLAGAQETVEEGADCGVREDLLSIAVVHPMREAAAVRYGLVTWRERLLNDGALKTVGYFIHLGCAGEKK